MDRTYRRPPCNPWSTRLAELLKERQVLHVDETPVQQLDPGKGKTKRAYLWAYRSNSLDEGPPIVVFEFQPGRSGSHARTFLSDWKGHLMVDDYAGYVAPAVSSQKLSPRLLTHAAHNKMRGILKLFQKRHQ
jgi:hypothetical protein